MTTPQFLLVLGRSSVEAGVLTLLILAAQKIFRRQLAPRWRCALWLLVAARLLVPVSVNSVTSLFNLAPSWAQPARAAPVSPPPTSSAASPRPAAGTLTPAPENAPAQPSDNITKYGKAPSKTMTPGPVAQPAAAIVPAAPTATATSITPLAPLSPVTPTTPTTPTVSAPRPVLNWPPLLFGLWLAGTLVIASYLLLSTLGLARRFRHGRRLRDPQIEAQLLAAGRQLGLVAAPLPVYECDRLRSPALYGCWRPRLLLPAGFTTRFSSAELGYVFLHELAHVRRRDLPLNWLWALLQVVHWFNPLVWFASYRWRADRELACDAMVLEAAGPAHKEAYGRTILHILESFTSPTLAPGLVGIIEDQRLLRERIRQIAAFAPRRQWPLLTVTLLAGLALVGLTDAQVASPTTPTTPPVPAQIPITAATAPTPPPSPFPAPPPPPDPTPITTQLPYPGTTPAVLEPNPDPTAQGHLDQAQRDLTVAQGDLEAGQKVRDLQGRYAVFLNQARAHVIKALAAVNDACVYVKAHPEINTLKIGPTPEGTPKILSFAIPPNPSRVPNETLIATIDDLNKALAQFVNNPNTQGPGGPVMDELGGLRKSIMDEINLAASDVLGTIRVDAEVPGGRGRDALAAGLGRIAQVGATGVPASNLNPTAQAHLEATQRALDAAQAGLNATVGNFGGFMEKAFAAVTQAQADVTEALAYVKAHPEINSLPTGPVSAEASAADPVQSLQNVAIPAKPASGFPWMWRAWTALNTALSDLANNTATDYRGPIVGDLGGYRVKIIADIGLARADVVAAFNFVNVKSGTPAPPAPMPAAAAEALRQGRLAADAKQWDAALGYFDQARLAAPDLPDPLFELGMAEAQMPGRELRAIGWLRAYLALAPAAPNAAAARTQIDQLDAAAESHANDFVALLKQVSAKFPASYATPELADVAAAITHASAAPAASPPADLPISSAQREKAWVDYVQDELGAPLFVNFQPTLADDRALLSTNITPSPSAMWPATPASRATVTSGGANNPGLTVFTHIRAQADEWIVRLAEVRSQLPEQQIAPRLHAEQDQQQAEARLTALADLRSHLATDLGIKLVAIPAGTFMMGIPPDEASPNSNAAPQTRVTLTQDFFLGSTDVTQGQYEAIMGKNPSLFQAAGQDAPVERVEWENATVFCEKLTDRECAAGLLPADYAFTLPTEAQWEYACRAGTTGPYAGDIDAMAWYNKNSGNTTHPVAQKQPNAWGLYDMYGDVAQWCGDSPLTYPGGAVTDPVGPVPGTMLPQYLAEVTNPARRPQVYGHVVRGGSYQEAPWGSASRRFIPGYYGRWIGFRIALVHLTDAQVVAYTAQQDQKQAQSRLTALAVLRSHLAADIGIKLVAIPAGTFMMGSPPDETGRDADEGLQTRVTLTGDFFLGATDVTQGQYEAVMGTNPSAFKTAGQDAPVEAVSWHDAMNFCQKLTDRECAAGLLPADYAFTLPTEAQWEYACRAETTGPYAGDLDAMAWNVKNSGHTTHPVGTKQPNAWGLYDMYGNVKQWCADSLETYPGGDVTDPTGHVPNYTNLTHSGYRYVARGGYWGDSGGSSISRQLYPGFTGPMIGFRIALVKLTDAQIAAYAAQSAAAQIPAAPPAPASSQNASANSPK